MKARPPKTNDLANPAGATAGVRKMAMDLYEALKLDDWPSPGTCLDFGIASQAH